MFLRLNAIREMCSRAPLVMTEDLLRDLAQYKNYRERSVMMAAKSLIHVYRSSMPHLLHKKDRVIFFFFFFSCFVYNLIMIILFNYLGKTY